MLYSKTEVRKILPRRIEYDQLSGNSILVPTNPVLGDVGRKKFVPVLGVQREFAELYNWFWWVKTSYCSQIWSKPCHPCRNLFLRTVGAILCCKVAQLLPSQQGVLFGVYTSWLDGDYQKIKI